MLMIGCRNDMQSALKIRGTDPGGRFLPDIQLTGTESVLSFLNENLVSVHKIKKNNNKSLKCWERKMKSRFPFFVCHF